MVNLKEENMCESPMGGWFGMCERYSKLGKYLGMGIGKAVCNLTYFNLDDEQQTEYTYQYCESCMTSERINGDEGLDDHQITSIKYFDSRPIIYPYAKIIIILDN